MLTESLDVLIGAQWIDSCCVHDLRSASGSGCRFSFALLLQALRLLFGFRDAHKMSFFYWRLNIYYY
jgi:hypothetical protein